MTDHYELLGFGAKITRRKGWGRVERVTVTEPIEGGAAVLAHPEELGGTRHQSAAQFVQDQRDAVALVASQDGRFTIFERRFFTTSARKAAPGGGFAGPEGGGALRPHVCKTNRREAHRDRRLRDRFPRVGRRIVRRVRVVPPDEELVAGPDQRRSIARLDGSRRQRRPPTVLQVNATTCAPIECPRRTRKIAAPSARPTMVTPAEMPASSRTSCAFMDPSGIRCPTP